MFFFLKRGSRAQLRDSEGSTKLKNILTISSRSKFGDGRVFLSATRG